MLSVGDFAARVQELRAASTRLGDSFARLERETRQRKAAFEKQLDLELARLRQEQAAIRERTTGEYRARTSHLEERRTGREKWISNAYGNARRALLARIDETEGRRKFAVQKGILDTEKQLDRRLKELEQEYQAVVAEAGRQGQQLGGIRESARKSFRGYFPFARYLQLAAEPGTGVAVQQLIDQAESQLRRFRARVLPDFFRFLPIWLWWLAGVSLFLVGPERLGIPKAQFNLMVGGALGGITLLYLAGWAICSGAARALAASIVQAEQALTADQQKAQEMFASNSEQARAEARERNEALQNDWQYSTAEASQSRSDTESHLDQRYDRALRRNQHLHQAALQQAEQQLKTALDATDAQEASATAALRFAAEENIRKLEQANETERQALTQEWRQLVEPAVSQVQQANLFAQAHFPAWNGATEFHPPENALNAIKFGEAQVQIPSPFSAETAEALRLNAPLELVLPREGSIFVESDDAGRQAAIDTLNNIIYRVLETTPPGKAAFTLIDPVRLGQSFSSIMHLADFEENIVNRRIWTEPAEIEERLLELNAHMEKVIQMYLRNEFNDIAEYNKEAGRIAERFHFVVIADFPASFTETALKRLAKIAASGARCGVYLLVHTDKRQPGLPGFDLKEFTAGSVVVQASRAGATLPSIGGLNTRIKLDSPPSPEVGTRFLQSVGEASRGSNTVQVPFSQIAPKPAERWSLETTEELRVPIGRSGATKLQYLSLGKGTRQHVLIAGKTGSGKSTLFHVLVTNLALWAGPAQVEFYLVDFKKGVEFKDYAMLNLPHARVVAIESDREFGLSVLQRIDEELRIRGELFRAAGAQDLAGYKRAAQNPRMPRVLLVVDEFQELFVEDDSISQNASLLLDRIVRQGRAFGIHVILGSQTLGGAYSLARSTLGQMVVRIALQTNEADAYLIMDESNPAPRLLSRPGEGIYNDAGGALEANSPFQVVWLPEAERREVLRQVRALGEQRGESAVPVVFEGNILADISQNLEVNRLRGDGQTVWLGLPNQIKGPTQVVLDKRSGKNLLIAGQQEDHARALLAASLISLSAHRLPERNRFVILETPPAPGQLRLADVATRLPDETEIVRPGEVDRVLRELIQELERRESGESGPRTIIIIQNLSAFKALRPEDEFSISIDSEKPTAAADFQRLYTEGPVHGLHIITHIDGFNNANRFLGRKGLKEFAYRVLFQMSANDSASFADDPRAGNLGLNRALLYNEPEGTFETFRPYARPEIRWVEELQQPPP